MNAEGKPEVIAPVGKKTPSLRKPRARPNEGKMKGEFWRGVRVGAWHASGICAIIAIIVYAWPK